MHQDDQKTSNDPIEVDNNYAIISKLMNSVSCRHYLFLDCVSTLNAKEIMKGVFSHEGPKNHMKHLKPTILTQQHFF